MWITCLSQPQKTGTQADHTPVDIPARQENMSSSTASSTVSSTVSVDDVTGALLSIVSEKTGYPPEMLETSMDMEADLGIDSIKRVEILGAMQEKFPELPQIDPAVLSDMRTLGQIIDQMSASTNQAVTQTEKPKIKEIVVSLPGQSENAKPESTVKSTDEITNALLAIVSEKTGYPAEMLAPDMDMEADLGIDSIKRVEILGAMQEKFPELPKADTAQLSDMRTLQQIIDVLSKSDGFEAVETTSIADVQIPERSDTDELTRGYVNLKSIPLADTLSVKMPEGSVTLLTDDGSDLTFDLAQNLIGKGHKVVIFSMTGTKISRQKALPGNLELVKLDETSESSLSTSLKDVQSRFGHVAAFIHLDPSHIGSEELSDGEQAIVKTVFLLAKLLKEDLTSAASNGFAAFMTVTHLDGQFGLSMSNSMEPISGGLFGLTKTLEPGMGQCILPGCGSPSWNANKESG